MKLALRKALKTALLSAVFFSLFEPNSEALAKTGGTTGWIPFESIKQKAAELILQKKKAQALQLISNYLKMDQTVNKAEVAEYVSSLSQRFVSKEAQDAYEESIVTILEKPQDSVKSVDLCLSLEPQNLQCLIQKFRLLKRSKSFSEAQLIAKEISEIAPSSKLEQWVISIPLKDDRELKTRNAIKALPDRSGEETIGIYILELERSFLVKNYSRAKEILGYLAKYFSDWPDILYYNSKLNVESAEEFTRLPQEQLGIYKNKCKGLTKTTIRKYRYDLDLCNRG